ncbi:P1 family peptidase [Alkalibacillus haloalkaliphilus]|uniref:Peptidase n=1 Tax=Alkalibacillus haloalkaliphilus TaxID=94136 RepID=A0A511W397_9BACI|nr:P1 family peptidase [Alkalibacillus haloalkaliphilus]GEN45566.1 peptidase [Alkalibacillus haloalkaliphilus]
MTITNVPGVKVGHKQNELARTGCTVILTEDGATCGVDVRGSAPGTRETDLLDPVNLVEQVHAISLAGGSAYGLDAASGVMQFLEEKGVGMDVGVAKVPIVPSAILFDLAVGDANVRPDQQMGYEAAKVASHSPVKQGAFGAGCGATVGKVAGFEAASKGGLGSASVELDNGLVVGAIVAVNAVGDVCDSVTGEILAGARNLETGEFLNSAQMMRKQAEVDGIAGTNTTIGAVAVNAKLTKAEAKKIAQMTQNALGRTISPAHTMYDGDTIFALATGKEHASVDLIGQLATEVMEEAIQNAVGK